MNKVLFPDNEVIIKFIKENPGCNRKQLENGIYKPEYGDRKTFNKKLSQRISILKNQNKILETDIFRARDKGRPIVDSKLFINNNNLDTVQSDISPKMGKSKKGFRQNGEKLKIYNLDRVDESILNNIDSEKNLSKVAIKLQKPYNTIHNRLNKLEKIGLVHHNTKEKKWRLTSLGEEKIENTMVETYSPDDSLFLHLPFLIKPGESFTIGDLVYRASSFYGFYSKHGLSQEDAEKDFRNKLERTLKNPLVAQYVQKIRFRYEVDCSENKLLLWRLYSMLHTVLYKSEKKRIGFGTLLFDDLIDILKDTFGNIEAKIRDLPDYQQYMVWLMYNGVQLETILPKMEIIDKNNNDIRDELRERELPLKVYNEGKENETTLIEESLNE